MPDLDLLTQLLGPQQPLAGPPQEAPQAPQAPVPQLSPTAQTIMDQSVQTPQDLFEEYRRRYFGLDPKDKEAQPTTKQRIKKGVLEALRGLMEPGYVNMPERLRAQADRDYQLQTPRLGVGAPMERVMSQLQIAANRIAQQEEALKEKGREADNRNDRAADRNANTLFGINARTGSTADALALRKKQFEAMMPGLKAKADLLNTQNQNLQNTGGLGGQFGAMASMLHMTPEQSAEFLKNGQGIRDATKFPPGSGGAGGGTSNRIFPVTETTLGDDGEFKTSTNMTAVNPKTLEMRNVGTIDRNPQALNPKDIEKVSDFKSASGMARDLAQAVARAMADGKTDYMGLLQGNNLSSAARASGLFGKSRDFNESLFDILKANGLFQHVSAFAGKRITNRELDYMNKVLGKKTDSPQSALSAALAASQLLEVTALRKGKLLSDEVDATPIMEAESARFRKEASEGKAPQLRSMRELLSQNGLLKKSSSPSSPAPAGSGIDKALLDEINKRLKK